MRCQYEVSRGAGTQSVTVKPLLVVGSISTRDCDCESASLSSATQLVMPLLNGRKWGTECLNTRFPLPAVCGTQREACKVKQKT